MGIKNCRHKGLKDLFLTGSTRRLGKEFHRSALMILDHLAAISDLKNGVGVKDFHPYRAAG
jgi:proteic killer suppression protein